MNTKKYNKFVLILGCMAILVGVAGYVFSGRPSSDMPPRIYFNTVGGPVLFPHQLHADPSQFNYADNLNLSHFGCADCHHELILSNQVQACEKCHQDDDYSPEDLDHDELVDIHSPGCTSCHAVKESEVKACRECHLKTGEPEKVSCDKCHPDEGYAPGDVTHEELEEIEGHWCTECHKTMRKADAIHRQCNRCHGKLARGTYAKKEHPDDQAFTCTICHIKCQ
jgi:hypothetical protein